MMAAQLFIPVCYPPYPDKEERIASSSRGSKWSKRSPQLQAISENHKVQRIEV